VFDRTAEFRLVGASQTTNSTLDDVPALRPRLVIVQGRGDWLDLHEFVAKLKRESPETRTVVWGDELMATDSYRAIQSGVGGVFRRTLPVDMLLECLREVAAGRVWTEPNADRDLATARRTAGGPRLTPRERDIVRLVSTGLKNREIAQRLAITTGTVKVHLMHVFEKTGVKDRYELAVQARTLLGEDGHE
jgi:DNA-binding NarL/FixJ family response regulator